jgi:hypothetical protein
LVVGQNGGGTIRKLAGQVKRTFTVSSVDEDCKKAIQDFWSDFKNEEVFSATTDRFAIVTQMGTNTLLQHFGGLLECARAAYDAQDFEHRLNTDGFISSTANRLSWLFWRFAPAVRVAARVVVGPARVAAAPGIVDPAPVLVALLVVGSAPAPCRP